MPVTASGGIYDNKSGNISSTEGGIGNSAEDTLTVNGPGLLLTKTSLNAGFQSIGPGATITYNYVLTNTGNTTLTGNGTGGVFVVSDNLATVSCPSTTTSLLPNQTPLASVTCTATYTATSADVTSGSVTNTATAQALSGVTPVTSNPSSVTIYLEALTLQKSTTTSGYQAAGATINYNYTITNTGKVTLYGNDSTTGYFTITDDHIVGPLLPNHAFTCGTVTSLAPGANTTCTASYTVTGSPPPSSVTNTATAYGQDKTSGSSNINNVTSNQSSVTVYQVNPPTIAKAFYDVNNNPVTQIPVGGVAVLTFTITNPNTNAPMGPLTGVEFSDTFPTGMTVANAPVPAQCGGAVTASVGANSISFSGGTILPSSSCTISVDVTLAASGIYNNTSGKVSSTNGGTGPTSNTATLTAIAPPTIAKAFSPTSIVVYDGSLTPNVDVSTLTFTLTNGNSSQLTGVGFTDNFLTGLQAASLPNSSCGGFTTLGGNTSLTLSGGSLAAGSTCTITVDVIATSAGTFPNTTTAVTSNEGGTGATSNTAILTSNPVADLSLTKTSNDADVDPGELITYTIVVTNNGPSDVTGATVADSIPSSLTGATWTCVAAGSASSASCTTNHSGNINDTVNISAGAGNSVAYTVSATVSTTATNDVINSATVIPPSGVTDTNLTNNSATVVDHLNLLSITKQASTSAYSSAGTVINYSYTIANIGTSTLTNLSATDNPLGALTCNSVPASFAPTNSFTCSASYTTTQADLDSDKTISNTATVTGTDKEGDTVTALSNTVNVTASQTLSLTLVKSDSPSSISGTSPHSANDVITYSYTLKNTGNVTLLPPFQVTDDHINGGPFTCDAQGAASLAPSAQLTCTNTYSITQTDLDNAGVKNTATGSATFGTKTVTSAPVTLSTPLTQSITLSLKKTANPSTYIHVDDVINYTYVLTNIGNVDLSNPYTVTDDKTTVACPSVPATLAPGGTVTCNSSYKIIYADLTNGSLTNSATAQAVTLVGSTPVNSNQDKATANAELATVTGTVFDDVNTSGTQDVNESGIPGVTVELYDSTGTTLMQTTTTDSKGDYSFIKLPAADYTVVEKDLAGYISTTSNTVPVTAPPNGTAQANFGDYQIAGCTSNTITGTVFNDANNNGVLDAGEQIIPGVTITLDDQNNNVVATTTTSANGSYSFSNVSAGIYTVVETNPAGYYSTTLDHVSVAASCNTSAVVNYGDHLGTETFTADPAISKYGDPSSAKVGSLVTYTITVGNNGPNNADNVVVTDTAPSFLTIISINVLPNQNFPITITGNTFKISFGTVTPHDFYTITIVTRVILGQPSSGINDASLSTATSPEPLFNNSASAILYILSNGRFGGI